jgi:sarcosine oxidase/L-pipecolate oxidase
MARKACYDVIVVGAGVMGAATADFASGVGAKTLLLEQFEIGHKNGSSHGDGRIFRYEQCFQESMTTEIFCT